MNGKNETKLSARIIINAFGICDDVVDDTFFHTVKFDQWQKKN